MEIGEWVAWKNICRGREVGGSGIRNLRAFNMALLGKWWWRLTTDKEGLWYRVLLAKYGELEGMLSEDPRKGSSWWKDVCCFGGGGGVRFSC